jgi:hypothetical protein
MAKESRSANTRYTWASIVFAYAIWHWREFPVWRLASVAAVRLALSLFIVGFCCWMERKPPVVGSASPNYVPHIRCLIISDAGITYDRRRNHPESLDWANVTGVEVVREVDWDMMLINFYWRILTTADVICGCGKKRNSTGNDCCTHLRSTCRGSRPMQRRVASSQKNKGDGPASKNRR